MPPTKLCTHCCKKRGLGDFHKRRVHSLSSWCKLCVNTYHRKQYRANRTGQSDKERNRGWKRRDILNELGEPFSVTDFSRLYHAQNGLCRICGVAEKDCARRLAVDHDHETRRARSLLCFNCNKGLGHFKDNHACLVSAAKYLKKFGKYKCACGTRKYRGRHTKNHCFIKG